MTPYWKEQKLTYTFDYKTKFHARYELAALLWETLNVDDLYEPIVTHQYRILFNL